MSQDMSRAVWALSVVAALGVTITSPPSLAAPPEADAPLAFSALPEASFAPLPKKVDVPKSIDKRSKFPGLYAALPPRPKHRRSNRFDYAGLFADKKAAEEFSKDQFMRWNDRASDESGLGAATVCISILEPWVLGYRTRWPDRLESWPRVPTRSAAAARTATESPGMEEEWTPRALRVERLVLGDGVATLHVEEGFIDPTSLGAKLVKRYSVPFKEVEKAPFGVRVFAAREANGATVHFMFYTPEHDEKVRGQLSNNMTTRHRSDHGSSQCGHLRLSLDVAPGVGDQGTAEIEVLLADETIEAPPKDPSLLDAFKSPAPPERELTIRTLLVHAGVSQGLADEAPVLGISFGFRGAERKALVF